MRLNTLAAFVAALTVSSLVHAQSAPQPSASPSAASPSTTAVPPQGPMADTPEARARWEAFRSVCGADLQAHCSTVQRGTEQARGEMRKCVDTHKAKFSTACQAAIAERDAAREARKQMPSKVN